ncbi:HAD family hydrolase [Caldalkalibacillus salinus]|uniref:HAD family hydrolase n=1 Tax=Caldalkalibacillus salinus TaxID=2803787 RepID=UPI0019237DFE|nr:HAD-IA family hydrolase [Caldalkalibacillus salinus]
MESIERNQRTPNMKEWSEEIDTNRGIIFDMDNTLLHSSIDFQGMREDLIYALHKEQIGHKKDLEQLSTPAQIIEYARDWFTTYPETDIEATLWEIVKQHEKVGMASAALEPGALECVQYLASQGVLLTVVTNNAWESAQYALERTKLRRYFQLLVGREQMEKLKPSPSGVFYVLHHYPQVSSWVMVGDAWIDGKAAQEAEVPFIAYKGSEVDMQNHDVDVLTYVDGHQSLVEWMKRHGFKR